MPAFQEQEYSQKFDFAIWKRLLKFARPYRRYLLVLAALMLVVAGLDAIFPLFSKYAVDNFIVAGSMDHFEIFIGLYLLVILVQAANSFFLVTLAGKIDMGVCHDIRRDGFARLQELSFSYFDQTAVGWIMARMTSHTSRLGDTVAWGLVDLVWGFAMMLFTMSIMLALNWKLALITLLVVPSLVAVSLFFQRRILSAHRRVRKMNSKITGIFNEGIMGARTTKTLVREQQNLNEFQEETNQMFRSSVRVAVFSSLFLPIVLVLGSIGTGLALWSGGRGVMLGQVSYGTLVAFLSYTVQFFIPIRELAGVIAEFQSAQAAAERTISMIDTKSDIQDTAEVVKKFGTVLQPKRENWPAVKGRISFENVSFAYKKGQPVLENFNLEIHPGETTALVGETGSGKSTIINLACRFYEPTAGRILIDGVDYRERSQLWLHANLGYVLQTPHLFSGTLRENIRYGRLDATDEEVQTAAQLVRAHDFIIKLPDGYDTEVGEGGSRISTGQKQLISFARAVLANPQIFVLDEATSSVDTETEKIIQNAIQKVLHGRTSFIIAHRLSTIRSADRILVIQNGKLTEEGTHGELLKLEGYYYRLYTNQFLEEHEAEILGEGEKEKI